VIFMKGYSSNVPENCAKARLEGVNASYKDLAQVCGRIRNKKTVWALEFLEKAANGEIPVLYTAHNRRLGHRRELGGRKGRYPKKAAKIVLKVLQSAIANGKVAGLGELYTIFSSCATTKLRYPRLASKGRQSRSFLETSRVEITLLAEEVPKGVSVTPPKKESVKSTVVEHKVDKKQGSHEKEGKKEEIVHKEHKEETHAKAHSDHKNPREEKSHDVSKLHSQVKPEKKTP